jgi:hypothetical protein
VNRPCPPVSVCWTGTCVTLLAHDWLVVPATPLSTDTALLTYSVIRGYSSPVLCPLSTVLTVHVSVPGFISVLRRKRSEAPIKLYPLKRTNPTHWPLSPDDGNRSRFLNVVFFQNTCQQTATPSVTAVVRALYIWDGFVGCPDVVLLVQWILCEMLPNCVHTHEGTAVWLYMK